MNVKVNLNSQDIMAKVRRELAPDRLPDKIRFFVLLNAGLFLTAVGIQLFKTPNHFAFGGTSGLSIVLARLFPNLPVSAFM